MSERCEHCGSDRIYHSPPDCPRCGAPVCCEICCKMDKLKRDLAAITKERDMELELRMGVYERGLSDGKAWLETNAKHEGWKQGMTDAAGMCRIAYPATRDAILRARDIKSAP